MQCKKYFIRWMKIIRRSYNSYSFLQKHVDKFCFYTSFPRSLMCVLSDSIISRVISYLEHILFYSILQKFLTF